MPTLNKLEYLDETKQEIKSALNTNFNTGITDEDTFRSYVNKIDNIYTNWPKVTGEGTEITLSNTKKGRMPLEPKGNTEQTTYTGKNLCSSAVFYNSNAIYMYFDVKKLAKTFTLSLKPNTTSSGIMTIYAFVDGSNLGNISTITLTSGEVCTKSITISDSLLETINAGTSGFISIYRSNAEMDITTSIDQPQIENNSSFTSYEPFVGGSPSPSPDYPQDIKVVKGNNIINIHGKNLLNPNGHTQTKNDITLTNNGDGTFTVNGKATANTSISLTTDTMILENNTTYTQSIITVSGTQQGSVVPSFKNSGGTISYNYFSNNSTKTTTDTMILNKYDYYVANGTTVDNWTFKVQLEKGSTATPYQSYTSTDYPLNLDNIDVIDEAGINPETINIELCKIGNYQDIFFKQHGLWHYAKYINKVVLDGSNVAFTQKSGSFANTIWMTATNYPNNFRILSNYFVGYTSVYPYDNDVVGIYLENNRIKCAFGLNSDLTTLQSANNWLSTHNTIVYYVLATPVDYIIEDATLIEQLEALYNAMSVDGTNIITSTYEEGNAPVIINATALMKGGN